MRSPKPKQNEAASIFVDLIAGMLHDAGSVDICKVLKANHGYRNGIEDHILNCSLCQRKMNRKAAR